MQFVVSAVTGGAKESAAHRRARRLRTSARFCLRAWLAAHKACSRQELDRACGVLRSHHSGSTLPAAVAKRLQLQEMAVSTAGWWCGVCRKQVRQKSTYCPDCGGHWQQCMQRSAYAVRDVDPPWRGSWRSDEARTPRARPSPRRRGKGNQKGKEAGDGQNQGLGKGAQGKDAMPMPPTLEALPTAPQMPSVALPKKTATEPPPDPAKAQLEALLGVLSSSATALPAAAQQMIATMQESTAQSTTKAMHKAVAEQARSRQALAKVQSQRATYLQAWHSYMSQLATLLEHQITEQNQVLESFDQSELLWSQADQQATQALARLAGAEAAPAEALEREMEVSEEMADHTIEVEQKLQAATQVSQESAKKMLAALHEMAK